MLEPVAAAAELTLNLESEAAARGLRPSMFEWWEKVKHQAHLERVAAAELSLDTTIIGGGMTAMDSLFAATPWVSLNGDLMINRFGLSASVALDSTRPTSSKKEYEDVTNYYAQIDTGTNGSAACSAADDQYKAFNAALSKYNCENTYSHWTCNDCRKAYARWAAAIALPACGLNDPAGVGTATETGCTALKPCIRVCNEVVQKCPITLGFRCPEGGEGGDRADYRARGVAYCDTMSYNETAGQSPLTDSSGNSWTTATAATATTYNNECCNSMGLTAGAAQHTVSLAAAVLVVSAWQLLA